MSARKKSIQRDEEWRPVPGYEGEYSVSNKGRVRTEKERKSFDPKRCRAPGDPIALTPDSNGYPTVGLLGKTHHVHPLVLRAFVGEPGPDQECDHIDRNPGNNKLTNLRWVTHAENMANANVQRGERHSHAKLTNADVLRIRELRCEGVPQQEIARRYSLSDSLVSNIVNGKYWRHLTKGRRVGNRFSARGERSGSSKLRESDVREIRRLGAEGELTQKEIGFRFGVSQTTVGVILRRESWTHLKDEAA